MAWVGLVVGMGLPYTTVQPAKWTSHMECGGDDKDLHIQKAVQLMPILAGGPLPADPSNPRCKPKDGRADAILLARWGRNYYLGQHKEEKVDGNTAIGSQLTAVS